MTLRTAVLSLSLAARLARARRAGRGRGRRPRLPGRGANPPERPPGHRRPDRLPRPRFGPDPDPDRLAERGRAGEVRLRPLLRAHDVPRDEGVPARRLPGDGHADRRAPERVHLGRRHELPPDVRQGGPREGPRDRGGPLHEPRLLRRRRSRRSPAPSWASTTRTPRTRCAKLDEVQRDSAFRDPHLQAHHDGLPRRHRGHAQPVRVLEDVLRALVPARVRDPRRGGRRRPGEGAPARRAVLRRSGSAARTGSRSRASRRRRARCTRTSHGRRRPCRGSRSRSTARRSRTCRRTGRRWTSSSTSTSARRATSTSGSSSRSRRSTRCSPTPAERGPGARHGLRAAQVARRRRLRPRRDPAHVRARPRRAAGARHGSPSRRRTSGTRSCEASTRPTRSPERSRGTRCTTGRIGR